MSNVMRRSRSIVFNSLKVAKHSLFVSPSELGSISHSGLNSILRCSVPKMPPARQPRVTRVTRILAGTVTRSRERPENSLVHTLALLPLVSPVSALTLPGCTRQQRQASRRASTRYSSMASSAVNQVLCNMLIVITCEPGVLLTYVERPTNDLDIYYKI